MGTTTSNQKEISSQKALFRLSAALFADKCDFESLVEVQIQMVKCVFVNVDNNPLSSFEIVGKVNELFSLVLTEQEVLNTIEKSKNTFVTVNVDKTTKYTLIENVLKETSLAQEKNLDSYIEKYITEKNIVDSDVCLDAIHRYLYEQTTSNIKFYESYLSGKESFHLDDTSMCGLLDNMSKEEKEYVNGFLSWEDKEKNLALNNLVTTCLEYCLLNVGDEPSGKVNTVLKQKRRTAYLDTNIIFRALGINGEDLKKQVEILLHKCKQASVRIVITNRTKTEFNETIQYYTSQIMEYPHRKIFKGAYEKLLDFNIFTFYHEWKNSHDSFKIDYFKEHIESLYDNFIKRYSIYEEKLSCDFLKTEEIKSDIDKYTLSIKNFKENSKNTCIIDEDTYFITEEHDSCLVRFVEHEREKKSHPSDVFFLSSDRTLQSWDLSRRESFYPVIVLPDQLFIILSKTCGRSTDDYSSFVSFINFAPRKIQMSPERANAIISGISTVTEDIESQKMIIDEICEGAYTDLLQVNKTDKEVFNETQSISENFLSRELNTRIQKIDELESKTRIKDRNIEELKAESSKKEKEIAELKDELNSQKKEVDTKEQEHESYKKRAEDRITEYAKKKTAFGWYLKWKILPISAIICIVTCVFFILLQFFPYRDCWNPAIVLMDRIGKTWFGEHIPNYNLVLDGAIFVYIIPSLYKLFFSEPKFWDKDKSDEDRMKRVRKYIYKHNLL